MAHPAGGFLGNVGEQPGCPAGFELSLAVFPFSRSFNGTAHGVHHELHAVTDSQNGDVKAEDAAVDPRAVLLIDAGRAAGKNDAFRIQGDDLLEFQVGMLDLTVNL